MVYKKYELYRTMSNNPYRILHPDYLQHMGTYDSEEECETFMQNGEEYRIIIVYVKG